MSVSLQLADAWRVEAKAPGECSDQKVESFLALVEAGGEVMVDGLKDRVRAAALLSFMCRGAELIGVAGLKPALDPAPERQFPCPHFSPRHIYALFDSRSHLSFQKNLRFPGRLL